MKAWVPVASILVPLLFLACHTGGEVVGPIPDDLIGPWVSDASDVVTTEDVDVAEDDASAPDVTEDAAGEVSPDTALPDGDAGPCSPGTIGCDVCETDTHCDAAFEDGNPCNGGWACVDGACVPTDPLSIDEICAGVEGFGDCKIASCHPLTGECVATYAGNGTACEDGDPCTLEDACFSGYCSSGLALSCTDGDPCTEDICADGACTHAPSVGSSCDDGNPCSPEDVCVALEAGGVKCLGTGSLCECEVNADCVPFEDGNDCNGLLSCVEGQCEVLQTSIPECAGVMTNCSQETCNPANGQCEETALADGSACSDGSQCTGGDSCLAGECMPGPKMACQGALCHEAACDDELGACVLTAQPNGTACSDMACGENATCIAGNCTPPAGACTCTSNADCVELDNDNICDGTLKCYQGQCIWDPYTVVLCPDADGCTGFTCDPATGTCESAPLGDFQGCDDGDPCTTDDKCFAGLCVGTACGESADPCLQTVCNPTSGCEAVPTSASCTSGDVCHAQSVCAGGACVGVTPVDCPDEGPCMDEACDSAGQGCVSQAIAGLCDDADPCTENDKCLNGACVGDPISCTDGELCTDDGCIAGEGCVNVPNNLICDDGNPCTLWSHCEGGACLSTGSACGCAVDGDCAEYDDGNVCNGTLGCIDGECVVLPDSTVDCPADGDAACLVSVCDPATGTCGSAAVVDGVLCDDGDGCTSGDSCAAGQCVGTPLDCNDGNQCTDTDCDGEIGCLYTPLSGACEDGNPCTASSECVGGSCIGAENSCSCSTSLNCLLQDDGDPCNGVLSCVGGFCEVDVATVVDCGSAGGPCSEQVCDSATGTCAYASDAGEVPCDDGDPCTVGEACDAGACQGGVALDCEGSSTCASGTCDSATGTCVYQAEAGGCDDGNPCTEGDACSGGVCVGTSTCPCADDVDCEPFDLDLCADALVCGLFGCEPSQGTGVVCDTSGDSACVVTNCTPTTGVCDTVTYGEGVSCDDGDACTLVDQCDATGACVGIDVVCDDGSECTTDSCSSLLGCVFTAVEDGSDCDDGDECTTDESCTAGACEASSNDCSCGTAADCPSTGDKCGGDYACVSFKCVKSPTVVCPESSVDCKAYVCNPNTGGCSLSNVENQTPCDDGDACTTDDRCFAGFCGGTEMSCDDGNTCTMDSCEDGACVATAADGAPCNDGNACTIGTTCAFDVCAGGVNQCTCSFDSQCAEYDDGDLCNGVWGCTGGVCVEEPDSQVVCGDADPFDCVIPHCIPETGACEGQELSDGTSCTDGSNCTTGDFCNNGLCIALLVTTCDDPADPCLVAACDDVSGACVSGHAPLGAPCSDGDGCTDNDGCAAGVCGGALPDCDDGESCTQDFCAEDIGCVNEPLSGGACDDGLACTEGTVCDDGACTGGTNVCACSSNSECAVFEDGDNCNGTYACKAGGCKLLLPQDCTASSDPCLENVCVPETGECMLMPPTGEVSCEDGDPCTSGDTCAEGACAGGSSPDCDDGNACTVDLCGAEGCSFALVEEGTPCSDGVACNSQEACVGGVCSVVGPADCACSVDADCGAYEDGNLCNGTLICGDAGQCEVDVTTKVGCAEDASGCLSVACEPATGSCVSTSAVDGQACHDGDPCTASDVCSGGSCAGTTLPCEDGDPCTYDLCAPGVGCYHALHVDACDDGDPCTVDDRCVGGSCSGASNPCDDENPCTTDSCSLADGCAHAALADGEACDDGATCTVSTCQESVCVASLDTENDACDCTDDEDCMAWFDPCDGIWLCAAGGYCALDPATVVTCGDGPCSTASFDEDTGLCGCVSTAEGALCDDGDDCTESDVCAAGVCTGTAVSCASDGCVSEVCVHGAGCVDVNVDGPCDDGDACTTGDSCLGGWCMGVTPDAYGEDFRDGVADGWTFASSAVEAGFQVNAFGASAGTMALYGGHGPTATLGDPGGAWTASASTPVISLPADASGVTLMFSLHASIGTEGVFTVSSGEMGLLVSCVGTEVFQACTAELPDSGGGAVQVSFGLDSGTGSEASLGVIVDEVYVGWTCSP